MHDRTRVCHAEKNCSTQKLQYTLAFQSPKENSAVCFPGGVDLTNGLHKYTQEKIPIQHKNGYIGSLVYFGYSDIYLTLFGVDQIGSYIMEDFEFIFFVIYKIDHIRQGS